MEGMGGYSPGGVGEGVGEQSCWDSITDGAPAGGEAFGSSEILAAPKAIGRTQASERATMASGKRRVIFCGFGVGVECMGG